MDGLGRIRPSSLKCVPGQSPSSFPLWTDVVKINLVMQSHTIAYGMREVMFTSVIGGHEAAVLK